MTDAWAHTIVEAIASSGIIIYIMANKRQAKQERKSQHEENSKKLDAILAEREYLTPHDHIEDSGNLQAEGIIRKPNGR